VVAHPTSEAPPSRNRPVWNAATTVVPKENVSGSTSVAWKLPVLVNGSVLIVVTETLARANDGE